jgi:hypothetical protein
MGCKKTLCTNINHRYQLSLLNLNKFNYLLTQRMLSQVAASGESPVVLRDGLVSETAVPLHDGQDGRVASARRCVLIVHATPRLSTEVPGAGFCLRDVGSVQPHRTYWRWMRCS